MLKAPAQFPHPGSFGFERKTGNQVRIISANDDGTVTVAGDSPRHGAASGTRRLDPKTLCESWPPRRAYNPRAAA